MNKFRIVLLLSIIVFLVSSISVCWANNVDNGDTKKKILFMNLVRNKSTLTILDESQSKKYGILVAPLKEKLQKENFIVIDDLAYFERMKKAGMSDIQSIEKSDILDLFKDANFDYIYMLEQEPWENRSGGKLGFQNEAHLKLLSINDGKYLYNGKLYSHTTWGSAFATHRKIAEQINAIIDEKLLGKIPEVKPATDAKEKL
ncbi:MAG TPA: hypothetical protein DCP36_13815 [Sporomusaceae bacterium]|nr:hypothetical protein [Sporomusaceae bacterium]